MGGTISYRGPGSWSRVPASHGLTLAHAAAARQYNTFDATLDSLFSTLPVVAGPLDRVSTVCTQLTTCQGIMGTVAMFNRMLSVSAVMILGKPRPNDLVRDVQAVIFGPCSRVGLKVRVRLSLFFF